ncbi:response regulator transcription factor [Kushneria aurantia]|uniref:Response regulator n=1 Tax=Kushneria aurantia TaxID=504092 RepID=A0ABV6G0A0_9GAMM|nr:response regulator transcription factor [Kushneria aurantia]
MTPESDAVAHESAARKIPGVVLIVDDQPDALALLAETLGDEGYTVIAAASGRAALERARIITPDIVLLDALMPGMDGFEVCLRMSSDPSLSRVPIIFMTGLTESEDIVRGFRAGGADYVTKPIKPDEILVRVEVHLERVRAQRQVDMVVNAGGRAALIADREGRIRWHSSRAPAYLRRYLGLEESVRLPSSVMHWIQQAEPASRPHDVVLEQSRLSIRMAGPADEEGWILTLVEFDDHASVTDLAERFGLTRRQAEVLLWVSRGKTNRDIAEILAMQPRTVNKHLEHIFPLLGVETRAAAAATALRAIGG